MPYVRERFFKGGEFTGLSDMRSAARQWCLEVAGPSSQSATHSPSSSDASQGLDHQHDSSSTTVPR